MQTFAGGDNEINLILGADESVARDKPRIQTNFSGVSWGVAGPRPVRFERPLTCMCARLETLTVWQVPDSRVLADHNYKAHSVPC